MPSEAVSVVQYAPSPRTGTTVGNNDVSTHRTAHKAPPYALP
nr:hypothetical protein [Neisseria meningitidis]